MRGKLAGHNCAIQRRRITPAHAGKTSLDILHNALSKDHPRACGENIHRGFVRQFDTGSPPRMRGKLKIPSPSQSIQRITPAHAGKTPSCDGRPPEYEDHPRACGENFIVLLAELAEMGSPPRMRGKPKSAIIFATRNGITPAHAGKTTKY